MSQDEEGRWSGRRLVDEQTPADPRWHAYLQSQHPENEKNSIIMHNRVFGLIAVGGCKCFLIWKI